MPSGQQLRTPDDRKCWAGNAVRQVGDGWRNADAAATDTVVRGRSDTGELSLQAWRGPDQARRASAVGRAVSDPGRDQTSVCRW